MNYLHMLTFIVYFILVFISGIGVYAIFDHKDKLTERQSLFLGEILLLGNILLIGELVALSLTHFYYGYNLWIIASLNLLLLFRKKTREYIGYFFQTKYTFDPALIFFILFFLIFSFRNLFPLMDNDSHSGYLWIQKLWLMNHTSIFGDIMTDLRVFLPHFDSVPYGLGIVLFGQETLYAGFINLFWRWVVLFLVFGYTSYRFNRYYGLAAALFVLLNDHFFYSGVNKPVLLNGAVIAFCFASVYNFWESREQRSPFRFMLAVLFLSQIIAVKFQMALVIIFLFILMIAMQEDLFGKCKEIISRKNWFIPLLVAVIFASLWLLKNFLATGLATFPVMAGRFEALGWTPESDRVYMAVMGGIDVMMFLKYMNYIFIWPGINAAKIVVITISLLPFILLVSALRNNLNVKRTLELSYWLGVTILIVLGISLACHQDPRYYRFGIGVMSFTSVYAIWFILYHCFSVKKDTIIAGILIIVSLAPIKLIAKEGGPYHYPSFKENIAVMKDKLHTSDLIDRYFSKNKLALKGFKDNPDKASKAAWDMSDPVLTSAFLLPERPHVGLWFSAIISWDSYEDEELIVKDLRNHGIEWIMDPIRSDKELIFKTPEEYAEEAVKFDRYPKKVYFDYGFPPELSNTGL